MGILRMFYFPTRGTWRENLAPVDAVVALLLLAYRQNRYGGPNPKTSLLGMEIGVGDGWFSSVLMKNLPKNSLHLLGVDPFPNGETQRGQCLKFLSEVSILNGQTYAHLERTSDFSGPTGSLDFIHVDGDHTFEAVSADLAFCERYLSEDGLLICDDWRHPYFPGVTAAIFSFLSVSDFRCVTLTANKAYLAKKSRAKFMRDNLANLLRNVGLNFETEIDPASRGYRSPPDFFASKPMLIVHPSSNRTASKLCSGYLRRRFWGAVSRVF